MKPMFRVGTAAAPAAEAKAAVCAMARWLDTAAAFIAAPVFAAAAPVAAIAVPVRASVRSAVEANELSAASPGLSPLVSARRARTAKSSKAASCVTGERGAPSIRGQSEEAMRILALVMAAIAGPVAALEISNCQGPEATELTGYMPLAITCDARNNSLNAIASMTYRIVIAQPDRTVPWYDKESAMDIPGGIEPHETRRITFVGRPFGRPADADPTKLIVSVIPLETFGLYDIRKP
jgi:hypothetical protein